MIKMGESQLKGIATDLDILEIVNKALLDWLQKVSPPSDEERLERLQYMLTTQQLDEIHKRLRDAQLGYGKIDYQVYSKDVKNLLNDLEEMSKKKVDDKNYGVSSDADQQAE